MSTVMLNKPPIPVEAYPRVDVVQLLDLPSAVKGIVTDQSVVAAWLHVDVLGPHVWAHGITDDGVRIAVIRPPDVRRADVDSLAPHCHGHPSMPNGACLNHVVCAGRFQFNARLPRVMDLEIVEVIVARPKGDDGA